MAVGLSGSSGLASQRIIEVDQVCAGDFAVSLTVIATSSVEQHGGTIIAESEMAPGARSDLVSRDRRFKGNGSGPLYRLYGGGKVGNRRLDLASRGCSCPRKLRTGDAEELGR